MDASLIFATASEPVLEACVNRLRTESGGPIDVVATNRLRERAVDLFRQLGIREVLPVHSDNFSEKTIDSELVRQLQTRRYGRCIVLYNNALKLGYQNVHRVVDFVNCGSLCGFSAVDGLTDLEKAVTARQPDHRFYVISFPRSGNSWLMESLLMLYNAKRFESMEYHSSLNFTYRMTADGTCLPFRTDDYEIFGFEDTGADERAVIKSHAYLNTWRRVYPRGKVIYIYRDARDALTSLYFYYYARKREIHDYMVEAALFSDYVSYNAWNWVTHVEPWLGQQGVHFVRYEDLARDFIGSIGAIIDYLGLEPAQSPERVQATLDERRAGRFSGAPDAFFRKGIVGDHVNYFTPELHETVADITGHLMRSLGYRI